jgi:membrane protein
MPTATCKAVLLDIDGTLVDSNDQHVTVWDDIFRGEGAVFERQAIHDQIGKGADMLLPTMLPDSDEPTRERLAEAHGEMFKARFLDAVRPFPGARDLIMRAHAAGQEIVLASSASGSELDHYLDLLDIRELVSATTSAVPTARTDATTTRATA